MNTPTPRTDAVYPPHIIDREFAEQGRSFGWGTLHDMRECSRQLETELQSMTAMADRLAEALGKADCGPDCKSIYYPAKQCDCGRLAALAAYENLKKGNTP